MSLTLSPPPLEPPSPDIARTQWLDDLPTPPGPRELITPASVGFDDPLRFLLDLRARYGDVVRFQTPYNATYLISRPDLVFYVLRDVNYPRGALLRSVLGEGLLSGEGSDWLRHRKLMVPDFHPRVIAHHAQVMTEAAFELAQRWRECARNGTRVDAPHDLMELSLHVIMRSLFSGEFAENIETVHRIIKTLLEDVGGFVRSECGIRLDISPHRNRVFQECLQEIDAMVYDAIARRRHDLAKGRCRHDLLDFLVEACDHTGQHMSDLEIRDEVVTMLFAGSETTAVSMGWTMVAIVRHENVDDLLQDELTRVLDGRRPNADDIDSLPYLQLLQSEVQRMYPPVWAIFRKVRQNDEIGGYRVEAGHTVIVSPFTIHYHPDYWPDPERFDPFRFTHENSLARPKYAYIPFGGGRHLCIGKHLSLLESQITTATLAQCFRWEIAPGHEVGWDPLVTLRLRDGLPLDLEERPAAAKALNARAPSAASVATSVAATSVAAVCPHAA